MKKINWIFITIILASVAGCGENRPRTEQRQSQEHTNVQIIRRYVAEILNKGTLSVADQIIGEDFVDPAGAPSEKGPKSLKKVIASFRSIFPDLLVTIDEMVVDGKSIAWKWTATGTHQAVMFGIPPTGKLVTFSGIIIDTIRNGKIVERQGIWDRMGLKNQLMRK
ncbi:MAG: ester cyclase [Deltaproteobacteria bacterium]|nr:ester cyclase [Deltaproteobacteria bacterium]